MERRPIASRGTTWAAACADWLSATKLTPNSISVLGLIAALLAGAAFAATRFIAGPTFYLYLLGALFVQVRLLANLFDGMVAERQNACSPIGELYNEIPDRFSDVCILVGFGFCSLGNPSIGFAAAIIALLVAYVRSQLAVSGAPQSYVGPMAKAHRMALVTATALILSVFPLREIWLLAMGLLIVGGVVTLIRRLRIGAKFLQSGCNGQQG